MDPWQMSAVEVLSEVAARRLSVSEMLHSALARIELLDTDLHAWITVDADGADRRARELDDRLAAGATLAALGGLPIGLKDVFYTAGLRTTASSRVLADFVPAHDAPTVSALRAADAVLVGKVHTAEFANGDPAPTRNPWNLKHTPGGSSSGSAVAVAAGMAPVALGTQTGGSTLRPAAYNGIVGFKPTYGVVSTDGTIPLAWSFDHVGVLARSVRDVEVVRGALLGSESQGSALRKTAPDAYRPASLGGARAPRVGLVRSFFLESCDAEVRDNVESVARHLERGGAGVVEVDLPDVFGSIKSTYATIASAETAAYHEEMFDRHADLYRPKIAARIRQGLAVRAVDYVKADRLRTRLVAELERAVDGFDFLLTPTTPTPAPRDLTSTGDPAFITPWSFTGLPTISLPSGVSRSRLPLGVQLIGRRHRDAQLLEFACWCEDALGVKLRPPCWQPATAEAPRPAG